MAGCHNSHTGSHRSRGAWIEIFYTNIKSYSIMGRIAHAVRGLKLFVAVFFQQVHLSHRSRGAWIEIKPSTITKPSTTRRIAHAVRGLKLCHCRLIRCVLGSHRSRGAWIEIFPYVRSSQEPSSHRSRGAWIEIGEANLAASNALSHRSRGAWIEIGSWASYSLEKKGRIAHAVRGLKSCLFLPFHYPLFVASLTRCVD